MKAPDTLENDLSKEKETTDCVPVIGKQTGEGKDKWMESEKRNPGDL